MKMLDEIILKVVLTLVGIFVTGSTGYFAAKIKEYKAKLKEKEGNENVQNIALQTILQSQLTNTYFVYQELGEIPDYVYKNWLNMLAIYEKLGGDDFIHTLAKKMENWKIVKTDILK
jgi:hypothetical protein